MVMLAPMTQEKETPRPWVKFWASKLHDHRFLRLNEIERYRYMGIYLCQAKGLHDYYLGQLDELLKSMAVQISVDAGQLHDSILRMQALKLVDHELRISDWGSEQADYVKDPTAADRKRRQRQREREDMLSLPAPAKPYESSGKSMSRRHAVMSRGRHGQEDRQKEEKDLKTTTTSWDWSYLAGFDNEDRVVVVELVSELDPELQQDLLDELAGARRKGIIKTSWRGWFRSTVKNAIDDDFQLNHGVEIARDRARRAQEAEEREAARLAEAERKKRHADPEIRKKGLEAMAAATAALAGT